MAFLMLIGILGAIESRADVWVKIFGETTGYRLVRFDSSVVNGQVLTFPVFQLHADASTLHSVPNAVQNGVVFARDTGAIPGGAYVAMADLRSGVVEASAIAPPEARGFNEISQIWEVRPGEATAEAAFQDSVQIVGPFANSQPIPAKLRAHVTGSLAAGTSLSQSVLNFSVSFGTAQGGQVITRQLRRTTGEPTLNMDEFIEIPIMTGPVAPVVASVLGDANDGGHAMARIAIVELELPPGFSFISQSGVFLTLQPAPPESPNQPPSAESQSISTPEDTAVEIILAASDPDDDALTFSVVSQPEHGVLSGTSPHLTYTPTPGYNGSDRFTFRANDGKTNSASAIVSITVTPVNRSPVAVNDAYTTDQRTILQVGVPGLLGNDSDADEGPLPRFDFAGWMWPSADDPDFTYGERFTGFYHVQPAAIGFDHPDGTLNLQYLCETVPWEMVLADSGYLFRGTSAFANVGNDTTFGDRYVMTLFNGANVGAPLPSGRQLGLAQIDLFDSLDFGADILTDDSIQITVVPLAAAQNAAGRFLFHDNSQPSLVLDTLVGPKSVTKVNGMAIGTAGLITLSSGAKLRVHANGSFNYDPNRQFDHLSFGAAATDTFVYEMSDRQGATATAMVTITIVGSNHQPAANAQSIVTDEDTPVGIVLTAADPDGQTLTFEIATGPAHGTLSGTPPSLTYTPASDYHGADSFTFKASDGLAPSAAATVTIDVANVVPAIVALDPASKVAGSAAFELIVQGTRLEPDMVVHWNGSARPTAFANSGHLTAAISAGDLAAAGDFASAIITVADGDGETSNPLSFIIIATELAGVVDQVRSAVAGPGGTSSVSVPPSNPVRAGVTASLINAGDPSAVVVTVATYTENPTSNAAFDAGGGFVDLKVSGSDAGDQLSASFYYPKAVTGSAEAALVLKYFDGSAWLDVRGSVGAAPSKSLTDDLDGTTSGGRFMVTFDGTSTPAITQLGGTIFALAVLDTAPLIQSVSGTVLPLPLGTAASMTVAFAAAGSPANQTVTFDWDDGTTSGVTPTGIGSASASHTYTTAGVYTVKITVADSDGDTAESKFKYIVIYDPNAGFVAGAGWINSPVGAYRPEPAASGIATFGFVSRYKKGATVPTGVTAFQLHMSRFFFSSTSYEWLVIRGNKAQYRGFGTINGAGDYKFILTAADADISGGVGADKFRIKIWNSASGELVYDNVRGESDDIDLANPRAIAGGSIVVHRTK